MEDSQKVPGTFFLFPDDTLATQTMSIAPTTGDITTQGQFSALGGMFTIELDPATSEPIVSIDNAGGVETYRFEAESGRLTLLGDLTMADADILMSPGRLVDGVDISALDLRVVNIENRLPPGSTPFDDIYVNETGDTMTGPLTATSFTGDGANITNIDGENIQMDSITATQIGENEVGSSEIAEDAVGSSEIDTDAVGSDEVDDGSIGAGDLDFDAGTGAGGQSIDDRFVSPSELPDFSDWDQDVTDDLTMADFTGWDTDASNDLITTTAFGSNGGDVTGTYDNLEVSLTPDEVGAAPSAHDHPHTHDYAPPHDHPYAPAGHTHPDSDPVSQQEKAFAHGSASGGGGCLGYNISGPGGPFAVGPTMNCDFDTDAPSTDYTIVVTPTGGGCGSGIFLTVTDKDPEDFTVTATCRSGGVTSLWSFDFVVYLR